MKKFVKILFITFVFCIILAPTVNAVPISDKSGRFTATAKGKGSSKVGVKFLNLRDLMQGVSENNHCHIRLDFFSFTYSAIYCIFI